MQIIKDDAKLVFNSWDEVVSEIRQKRVKNPDIGTTELLKDIEKIKETSQKTFFSKPQSPYISSLINQIRLYQQSKRYSFIEDLHIISRLIVGLQTNSKSKKLFEKKIFSNFGFFSQFLVSAWLNKYLKVIDFELNNPPFQTDVLVDSRGKHIHFHIKDITESEREERLSNLCIYRSLLY